MLAQVYENVNGKDVPLGVEDFDPLPSEGAILTTTRNGKQVRLKVINVQNSGTGPDTSIYVEKL